MKKKLHIVPHTHWDREWHLTFEQFREKLIILVDKLIDILEKDPSFKCFTLDGQAIILEDYLEKRPQNAEKLKKLINKGRILIGPWYVLPDEFLVSGESLLRNLIFGHKIAAKFGRIMKIGYLPDQFGHSAAIPKILKSADIPCTVIWRGVPSSAEKNEFVWEGDDGTRIMCVYLRRSYSNGVDLPLDKIELIKRLKTECGLLEPYASTPDILIMNGSDHKEPQEGLPAALEAAGRSMTFDIIITNLAAYRENLIKSLQPGKMQVIKGELRDQEKAHILPGVLSSRVYLKQESDSLETLLSGYAEPMSVFAFFSGMEYPEKEINSSWRLLLQNHPHDSICGCSIDAVHDEMMNRFEKAGINALNALNLSANYITGGIRGKGDKFIVFNMSGRERTDFVRITLPDGTESGFTAEKVPPFGYKDYYLYELKQQKTDDLLISRSTIENRFFRIVLNKNGSINITDKTGSREYKNCLRFEETGDAGDEYNYSPPPGNFNVITPVETAFSTFCEGNYTAAAEIKLVFDFPKSLSPDRKSRSKETTRTEINSKILLHTGIKRVEFCTRINNRSNDHRIRVLFPMPFSFNSVISMNHFGNISRPITIPQETENYIEKPVGTHPNTGYFYVSDGNYKCCISSEGLREYEVIHGSTLALTLIRSTGWLSKDDLSYRKGFAGPEIAAPGAQMLGGYSFNYSFSCGEGYSAIDSAMNFRNKLIGFYLPAREDETGEFPASKSYLSSEPEGIIISAFKRAEDGEGVIIRAYNASEGAKKAQISPFWSVSQVSEVNILETDKEITSRPVSFIDSIISFDLKPNEFISLRLK